MFKVGLYTLGCKVSSYETEAVAEEFESLGFEIASFDSPCDVYVINTCTVTAESDAKCRKYIRRAVRMNPRAVVAVMGCFSQRSPEAVASISGVSIVVGTQEKLSIPALALEFLRGVRQEKYISVGSLSGAEFENMKITRAPRTRGYVKIEDGCDCRCSYCAISAARGPVRSKPMAEVIAEVEGLYKSGTREIVLVGIETGSYGADLDDGVDLATLIAELDRRSSCNRIRLGSMAPELLGESFISRVANLKILVPHFHISLQSGSDRVLAGMRRRYNSRQAMANIRRIRELMPRVMLTADLMVGFPGESEEDFSETVAFLREAKLLDAHVFAYSRREGTAAAEMKDQIPEDVKRERSARLISLKNRMRDEVLSEVVSHGEILPCIFETRVDGEYVGHSDSYIEVVCPSDMDLRGEIVNVLPLYHKGGKIFGKALI